MHNLIKKRAMTLILLAMASVIVIFCAGCNNSTPTQANNNEIVQKKNFNEEDAKKQSRLELNKFLALSANKTFIANDDEKEKIKAFVNDKCKQYFTNDFINDTTITPSMIGFANTYSTFYLVGKAGKVSFYNNYKIYSPTVDKENETITYELEAGDIGFVPTTYVNIQMKMENGKWKINKALH